jgi:lipopolysaccharide export system protein LptA
LTLKENLIMKIQSLLFTGALALTSLTMAYAKSYQLFLTETVQAGNVKLTAGQYSLRVEGSNAVFTRLDSDKSYRAQVKIDQGTQKFPKTALDITKEGDTEQIKSIELEGSTTTLEFGN